MHCIDTVSLNKLRKSHVVSWFEVFRFLPRPPLRARAVLFHLSSLRQPDDWSPCRVVYCSFMQRAVKQTHSCICGGGGGGYWIIIKHQSLPASRPFVSRTTLVYCPYHVHKDEILPSVSWDNVNISLELVCINLTDFFCRRYCSNWSSQNLCSSCGFTNVKLLSFQ